MKNNFKLVLIVVASLLIYSCGQSKGWSKENKEKFIKGCVNSSKRAVSEEKANEICNCLLNKMMEKYPTMKESQVMSVDEIREMGASCK